MHNTRNLRDQRIHFRKFLRKSLDTVLTTFVIKCLTNLANNVKFKTSLVVETIAPRTDDQGHASHPRDPASCHGRTCSCPGHGRIHHWNMRTQWTRAYSSKTQSNLAKCNNAETSQTVALPQGKVRCHPTILKNEIAHSQLQN